MCRAPTPRGNEGGAGGEFRSLHRLSYCPFSATASDAELTAPALSYIVLGGAGRGRRETGHWRGRSRWGVLGLPVPFGGHVGAGGFGR